MADTERCPGCELKDQLRGQLPKDSKGVHVVLRPNPALRAGRNQDGTVTWHEVNPEEVEYG